MRNDNRPKTLKTYYPLYQYKNLKDIPKRKNIDFALYFEDYIKRDNYRMLEIGCANGNFLANDPKNIIGVDINMNLLKVAREHDFNVLCTDVENGLTFKDESFDAIYAAHIIEHLKDPIYFLTECYRILKPTGLLLIVTPNFSTAFKIFYDDPTHVFPLTKESLKKCALEAGFKKFKVERQNVPIGMGLLLKKGFVSLRAAISLSRSFYKIGIYRYKWAIVLLARKGGDK